MSDVRTIDEKLKELERGPYLRALGELTEMEAKVVWGAVLLAAEDLEKTPDALRIPMSAEIFAALRSALLHMPTKGEVKDAREGAPAIPHAARVREPCPKCGAPIRAKTMSEGGGVKCSSASCNYWFCY